MCQTCLFGLVYKCQHFHEYTNHTVSATPTPPPKKRVQINILLSAKNPHENNKNQAKRLIVYRKNVVFHRPLVPPPKVYSLYTRENVDIYGQPLIVLF